MRASNARGAFWRTSLSKSLRSLRALLEVMLGAVRLDQRLLRGRDLALAVPEPGVEAALGQQMLVSPPLGDHALVEHENFVGVHDGREPVRDDQRGAPFRDALQ